MANMANWIAFAALLAWPVVTLVLFLSMSTSRAIVCSLLAAYLLLPPGTGFDFPGVPTLDKSSIPNVAAFLLAMGLARPGEFRWPRSATLNVLMAIYVFGPLLTGFGNRDPIIIGTIRFPEVSLYTDFSSIAGRAIELMPFLLGVGLMRNEKAHRDILLFFVLGAVIYSLPVIVEVIKGPFLLTRVYGIDPGAFYIQQVRQGGFRAPVFLGHGLLVSAFFGMAVLAAIGLWRSKQSVGFASALFCALYLFAILIINKSAGAILFALLFVPLLTILPPRRFLMIALTLALVVVSYPVLRASGLVPVDTALSLASSYSQDRAASLQMRLQNEDMLLNRAHERPLFGWGGFGRSRIWVADQSGTRDISTTDGTWIITMGVSGWVGYLSLFGLLCYPFWHMFRVRKLHVSPASAALAAMLLVNLLDLIPNSSLRPVTWLIAGALAGLAKTRQGAGSSRPAAARSGPLRSKAMTAD